MYDTEPTKKAIMKLFKANPDVIFTKHPVIDHTKINDSKVGYALKMLAKSEDIETLDDTKTARGSWTKQYRLGRKHLGKDCVNKGTSIRSIINGPWKSAVNTAA